MDRARVRNGLRFGVGAGIRVKVRVGAMNRVGIGVRLRARSGTGVRVRAGPGSGTADRFRTSTIVCAKVRARDRVEVRDTIGVKQSLRQSPERSLVGIRAWVS